MPAKSLAGRTGRASIILVYLCILMLVLYNIAIRLYYLYILAGSLVNRKARFWITGRRGLLDRIRMEVRPDDSLIWFHCSSLGEFEQGRPVMEALKITKPGTRLLLTFFSPSGYEVRKNYAGADHVYYLPLDTKENARQFIRIVRPAAAYFIKYEFWYHYLHQLSSAHIPVYLISAIFRPSQVFFKGYGRWFRSILGMFSHIFVQDDASGDLLKSIGLSNMTVSGDTRFDRVSAISGKVKPVTQLELFRQQHCIIIAGSTWPEDDRYLVSHINLKKEGIKYILVPHEIHDAYLSRLERTIAGNVLRFSGMNADNASRAEVLVVDAVGYLSSLYRYADIAYVGGGFGKGIHNTLEAATFGIPVIFGPNYHKFREARDMIREGAAFSITGEKSLTNLLSDLLADRDARQRAGKKAKSYVERHTGATARILNYSLEQ
jgi:3-deoxy-D-manno-octulosonic-acid transferase